MAAKKKVHTLTASLLWQYGPCSSGLELFRKTFPRGARITAENGWRAMRAGLDLGFVREMLTRSQNDRILVPLCSDEHCTFCNRRMEVFIAVLNECVGQLKKLEARRRARARDRRSA